MLLRRHREWKMEGLAVQTSGRSHGQMAGALADRPKADFLIYSLPRSGSTTLMELLNCSPEFRCVHEPFNPDNKRFCYHETIHDLESLDSALSDIRRTYNGVKHVWDAWGWPFEGGSSLNDRILTSFQKVLLLSRRNSLQRLVSCHISKETGIYAISRSKDRRVLQKAEFTGLEIDQLAIQLQCERVQIQRCRKFLQENEVSFMDLAYEDLLLDPAGVPSQIERVNSVIEFLGGEPLLRQNEIAKMVTLLDPGKRKMNSTGTYSRIPDILEIEKRFGSDETGWLFK